MMTGPGDTLNIAAADTLSSPAPKDEFSIGRIIPLRTVDRNLPGQEINARDLRSDYITGVERIDGQPRPQDRMSTDFSFIILSLSLLVMTVLLVFGRKNMIAGLSSIGFRRRPELAPPGTSEVFGWPSIFRNTFTVLNVALFAVSALLLTDSVRRTDPSGSVKLAALLIVSCLAALLLRHLTCIMTAEVTGWKSLFREYMNVVYNTWFANSILLFILNGIILFAKLNNTLPFIFAGLIITAIFLIIRTLRLLAIFKYRHISISYFILYLCALEVLPVLVMLKILGVF
jgi:hypothetical protein